MRTSSTFLFVLLVTFLQAQSTFTNDGIPDAHTPDNWETTARWSGTYPGTATIGGQHLNINGLCQVGTPTVPVNLSFAANNDIYNLTINDTLIVYGDVSFANKAMNLVINGALIIIGNLTAANKLDLAAHGILVVTGSFSKTGTQGTFSGSGTIYAGSYNGSADAFVPGSTATTPDQQQTIADLAVDADSTGASAYLLQVSTFINNGGNIPLPVELVRFYSDKNQHSISLHWQTASEINTSHFELFKSHDGKAFVSMGILEANGNSSSLISYYVEDFHPFQGMNYYRIASVDFDGYTELFDVIAVSFQYEQLMVYPNAFDGREINLSSFSDWGGAVVSVNDLQGRSVYSGQLDPLYPVLEFNPVLTPGIYFLTIHSVADAFSCRILVR